MAGATSVKAMLRATTAIQSSRLQSSVCRRAQSDQRSKHPGQADLFRLTPGRPPR
jgi:hypothetical protein